MILMLQFYYKFELQIEYIKKARKLILAILLRKLNYLILIVCNSRAAVLIALYLSFAKGTKPISAK